MTLDFNLKNYPKPKYVLDEAHQRSKFYKHNEPHRFEVMPQAWIAERSFALLE
jgi:hypothetical protein